MVNGVTYFYAYISGQGACLDETSVFSNAVRFALKLPFGTKNNQLHDYSLFLQNDTEILDLPLYVPPAPVYGLISFQKLKSLSVYNLLPPK